MIDAARHRLEGVNIETAVGLVENRETRFQHCHLEDFVALFLAARKSDVDGALQQILANVQELELCAHDPEKLAGIELWLGTLAALRIDGDAQEIHVVHTRDLDRVLESEKQPFA